MWIRKLLIVAVTAVAMALQPDVARSEVIATRVVNGKTYYVDVVKTNSQAEIWFRVQRNACSNGDVKGMTISRRSITKAASATVTQAAQTVCTVKSAYDNGKTILGCAATVTTGVCVVAAVPTGGTSAVVCQAVASYTINKGFADCLDGVSDLVAYYLVGDANWSAFMTGFNVGSAQWSAAVSRAIDLGCANIR